MTSVLLSAMIAVAIVLLMILLCVVPVHAQSWASAITSGYTSVLSVFDGETFTWTLTNNTSLPTDTEPAFDVLVWSLIPYQVREPLSWTAPDGWIWANDRWQIASRPSRKYYTPDALAPGASLTFTYTPDPEGRLINSSGPQPSALGFIAHVGAVVPGSGSPDGTTAWQPVTTNLGATWYDMSADRSDEAVSEPGGALVLVIGAVCALSSISRVRRYTSGRNLPVAR